MKQFLVALSLGPVQSLIGAARRTRDLWCGSWLLAEAAKAAARAFHDAHAGCLIFPCCTNADEDLAPAYKPRDDDANIANILRAQISAPDVQAAQKLVGQASQAARQRLAELCLQGKAKLRHLPFHEDLWQAQQADMLEIFGAWIEIHDAGYADAAERLTGLLAARKVTRDFVPAARAPDGPGYGIPKSSLDGARESVINLPRDERTRPEYRTDLRKLGLAPGEELDVLGIAKRMAGNAEQFTAYSRIAADAWIESLPPDRRGAIAQAYEKLIEVGLATRVTGNAGIYANLPYDAQLLFGFRLDNALTHAGDEEKPLKDLQATLRSLDEPVPYAAILKADGDRMGELLDRARTADDSRAVSTALHDFAKSVRRIVREHRGHAIYAGGDDVLALLPLGNAVACAQALATNFRTAMNDVAARLGVPEAERPTLSAGVGIGHLVEPLGRLRARADAAERLAKGDGTPQPRNALGIQLGIRSGGEHGWRCRWDDEASIRALNDFSAAYRNADQPCPSRLGYDLRSIAQRLAWAAETGTILPGIHAAELARTLQRARQRGGEGELSAELKARVSTRAGEAGLSRLADELIIARWLSARTQADIGTLE